MLIGISIYNINFNTTAEELKESLLSALQNLDESKLVQISGWTQFKLVHVYRNKESKKRRGPEGAYKHW